MNLQQAFYEEKFEIAFLRARGDAFQDFFERLMGFAYKADFMACRPWGNRGDRKNDGFLRSERRLFQVYAPNEMKESVAIPKIREDFEGARIHWGVYFNEWVFVHNGTDGLPPHVQKLILELEKANTGIKLETWGLEELRLVFRRISTDDLQSWFGFAPTDEARARLGFRDIQVVLERIGEQAVPFVQPVRDVPMGKIKANALSESVAALLKAGMAKAPLVDEFYSRWHDATLGERIAQSFRTKYESLRGRFSPNEIFAELQVWVGGDDQGTPEHQLAVLAVMAYYFESCDIFEEARGDES